MSILQIGGLASGLDTHQIIDQLISIARRPRARLESKVTQLQSQKMSIQTLDVSLLALQTQVSLLSNGNSLLSNKVTSSDTSSVSATISSSVNPEDVALGTYKIDVIQLAEPYKIASGQNISKAVNPDAVLNEAGFKITPTSGKFSINGVEIEINLTDDETPLTNETLTKVINTINDSATVAQTGVRAFYNSQADKLILYNADSTSANAITLGASSDTSNFLNALGLINSAQTRIKIDAGEPELDDGNPIPDENGANSLSSLTRMGGVNPNLTLNEINLATAISSKGNFQINNVLIEVTPSTETLQDIINKINSSQAGVTASYNSLTDQLELTSNIGSAQISLADNSSNFLKAMKLLDNDNNTIGDVASGRTAQFKVNGTLVEQNSNTNISGIISGVTLNLLAETDSIQLTVERDVDSAVSAVRSFINQYNTTQSLLRTAVQNSALRGDTSMSRISQRLFSMMIQPIGGLPTNFNRLSDIGIGRAKAGTVTLDNVKSGLEFSILDESQLRNAIAENPTAVADMFRTTGSGSVKVTKAFQFALPAQKDSNEIVVSGYALDDFNIGEEITIIDGRVSEKLIIATDGITYNKLNNAGWRITPTSGAFYINGKSITIDVENHTIDDVVGLINGASAGVTAHYNRETGRLTLRNATDGDTSDIELSVPDENASNFLTAAGWLNANQTPITTDPESGDSIDPTNSVSGSVGIGRTTITFSSNLINDYTTSAVVGEEDENGAVTLTKQSVGLAAGMESILSTYTQTATGVIDNRLEIYDQRIENVQKRLDDFDVKIEQLRTRYVAEYAKLESALAVLQSQSSYVSQQLYSLQNSLMFSFNRGLY